MSFLKIFFIIIALSFGSLNPSLAQTSKGAIQFTATTFGPPKLVMTGKAAKEFYKYLRVVENADAGFADDVRLKSGNGVNCRYYVSLKQYDCEFMIDSGGISSF